MGMPVILSSQTTRGQAISDMIESIALEQTALAHILNAEGEKLQRVINAAGATPEQMLCTNKSVEKMINAVARLEMVLQGKLSLFEDCLCPHGDHCPTVETSSF